MRFEQSDTALVPRGGGTGGSRSLQIGGSAVAGAAADVVALAREVAARMLEASVDDVLLEERSLPRGRRPDAEHRSGPTSRPGRARTASRCAPTTTSRRTGATFPFGAHVAVVEVDTETGNVTPTRHVAVDDCGRILNPLLVEGQQHGGIAQGMAQALCEEFCYDDAGQPGDGDLRRLRHPRGDRAAELRDGQHRDRRPTSTRSAPRGSASPATIGSTPAVHNAVVDALSHLGVRHVDMPLTPQRVVEAVRRAADGTLPDLWREPPAVFDDLKVRGGSEEVTNI